MGQSAVMPDVQHPLAHELALAHAGRDVRPVLGVFLELDQRLAQFVSQAKEPMLAQMRIAWWRDQLGKEPKDRPQGDAVLDRLTEIWAGEEDALIGLVDGWEGLLADPPLPVQGAQEFVSGRAGCFAAIARLSDCVSASDAARLAGLNWAFADLVSKVSDAEEKAFVLEQADLHGRESGVLPYKLRALHILGKLGRRAIERGGTAMISGRTDLLLVSRLGLLGK